MNTTALNEFRIGVTFGFREGWLHSEGQAGDKAFQKIQCGAVKR